MGKTITIEEDVYQLLSSLKQGTGDSFTKVIRRHVHKPADTAGELLEAYQNEPGPEIDLEVLSRLEKERKRQSSGGRK